jgi:signal transduction histidine kinase
MNKENKDNKEKVNKIEELLKQEIAKRKELEEKLKNVLDELEQSNRDYIRTFEELEITKKLLAEKEKLAFLGEIAGAVGHELRNPLAAIKNNIYYLSMILENPSEEFHETVECLNEDIYRSTRIIKDLLDYSKVAALDLRSLDVNNFITELISKIKIPENIELEKNLKENISNALLDRIRFEQILTNLITNAFDAMEDGGILTIETSQQNNKINIQIKDTGIGIEPNNLEKIYHPLFTTKAKGFGLGLAIVKRYVETHNGTLSVQSKLGEGTSFQLKFPIIKEDPQEERVES